MGLVLVPAMPCRALQFLFLTTQLSALLMSSKLNYEVFDM